jgi:hypothetical protein
MLRAAILSAVLLIAQLSGEIDAASVMTTNGRVQGKILTENAETVTVGAESGSTQVIKRFDILIIYDDAGNVLWQNPDIASSEAVKEAAPAASELPLRKIFSAELHAGGGLSSPSSLFSSFYASSGPDYHYEIVTEAAALWHFTESDALVFGLGYGYRNLTAAGINLNAQRGTATWPLNLFDTRIGYRMQGSFGFAELGFLYALPLGTVSVQHQSAAGTAKIAAPQLAQQSYGAVYLAAGFSLPLNDKMALLTFARMDQGLGAAVRGEVATQVDFAGKAESTTTLALVPWSVGVYLGVNYRI